MSEVKRFDHVNHAHVDDCAHIENPGGAWVKASDYDALAAEAQALREEVAKLRARVVPREVLERSIDRWACCAMSQTPGAEEAWEELRALLSEQEGGKQ
ncbi:hypothetical protein KUU78_06715 [Pseudomonas aeruginosa]|uniref:hypothetical protein n=1 Tax=Pseudomonas aeruginosa TaxID=287 RepID=UPI001C9E1C0B|nr:hypothetical protein [Pseudomonas aeruginosa]MBY9205045.1 hypothetical protein [Pseudomonas aeruginosa]MBY9624692.1 hypothetical protein [Pseudomonas aeruginosa]MBY9751229.1 hypothetical protein [Pseudomonas aeruginosa]MCA6844456.1 hypothetical protein [Pseudomonas aeruginosa]QZV37838.1 hypothetical protein KUU78_06715 [Pseudomonas aeruginosa]